MLRWIYLSQEIDQGVEEVKAEVEEAMVEYDRDKSGELELMEFIELLTSRSVLGLDVVADLGIGDKIDEVVSYADALGPLAVLGFIGAWVVAKVFLIDFISIALALSSGILFGGVFPGALLATTGATIGSLVAFQLSRGIAQPRSDAGISHRRRPTRDSPRSRRTGSSPSRAPATARSHRQTHTRQSR